MTRYNDLIFKYKKEFKEDINLLRKFMFELCNDEGIDLYYRIIIVKKIRLLF